MQTRNVANRRFLYVGLLIFVLAVGYLSLAAVSVGNPRPATPIRLVSGVWEPFVSPELDGNGPITRIVTETFQRIGYEPEITFASWDSILDQTERVEVLGAFPFIASETRRDQFYFSDPILEFDYVLFYYRPNIANSDALTTAEDFINAGYRFGKVEGYEVWPALAQANFAFQEYPTREDAFQALADGEIHFLPESRLVGQTLVRGEALVADATNFGYLENDGNDFLGATEELFLMIPQSEGARRLLDAFNAELRQVQQTTVYSDAVAEIENAGRISTIVELQPQPGEILISLFDMQDQRYLAPLGSRALVITWPSVFSEPISMDNLQDQQWVTVKLLNGPLQGRVMRVDAQSVQLLEP